MKLLLVRSAPSPLPLEAVDTLAGIWRGEAPDCMLFLGGSATEQLAARLSVRLGIQCCTGAVKICVSEKGFSVTRRFYSGEMTAVYTLPAPCLIVLDTDIDPEDAGIPGIPGEPLIIEPGSKPEKWYDGFAQFPDDTAGDLKSAARIVAAGRGTGNKAQYRSACELAEKLGAAVGATRAAVYNGWAQPGAQIGISGTAVKPDMCLVIGASGSQAFLGAIGKNTKIIAVNNDPDAPVFRRANWGIVCDAGEILRELITRVNK